MRLLRVIATMNPASGGPCQGIRNSIPKLEELGVHNEVVSLDDPLANFLNIDPFPIYALGPAKGPWNYSPKLIPWLLRNFKNYDAIIVHGLWLYHGFAVRKALLKYKNKQRLAGNDKDAVPKLYVMPHGMLDPYFQQDSGRGWKAKRNMIYWKLVEEKVINQADGLLFTCEEELRLAKIPFRPYSPKKELNVGYGILPPPDFDKMMHEAFTERVPNLKDRKYLLFLSRIHEKKGVDILIEAYRQVARERLNGLGESKRQKADIPGLVIAGPGMESPYGMNLQKVVASDPILSTSVHFAGMLSGNAKWGAFYGSEAFVLASHQENFGISVVEALACYKPVLITDKVNIWREIQLANGGLVSSDTVEGIEFILKKWLSFSFEEQKIMRENARTCFERNFSVSNTAKQLAESLGTV